MAKIRRVVQKVPKQGAAYFDEQLWPVSIGLVVLGGFLIGVSLAYQPLSGVVWYRTAWPSLIGIPLVIGAAMMLLARIDNRVLRRSLQLSLVLCAILHVALVVEMIQTRIFSGAFQRPQPNRTIAESRPKMIVPEYHPTQLVAEDSRPQQDFEKPVETKTPEPERQPEQTVRQETQEDRSPAQPQPIPVPEQARTVEPNVVDRRRPNEAAPRLSSQTSRLARQQQQREAPIVQSVELPKVAPLAKALDVKPSETSVARQENESPKTAAAAPEVKPIIDNRVVNSAEIERRPRDSTPAPAMAKTPSRPVTSPRSSQPELNSPAIALPANAANSASKTVAATSSSAALSRQMPSSSSSMTRPKSFAEAANSQDSNEPAARGLSRAQPADVSTIQPYGDPGPSPRRAVASAASEQSPITVDSPAAAVSTNSELAAAPTALAISRGEAGIAGRGRSPNLDSSMPGAASPSLIASGAARRREATQQERSGDALSPAAPAQIARAKAGAALPTATVRAEQVDSAMVAGGSRLAEVNASSSAAITQADAAARKDAVTASKGSGEIDVGPTQLVAQASVGRVSGGGQPEISPHSPRVQIARAKTSGGAAEMSLAADEVGKVAAPAGSTGGAPQNESAGPAAITTVRSEAGGFTATALPAALEPVDNSAATVSLGTGKASRERHESGEAPSAIDRTVGGGVRGRQVAQTATSAATDVAAIQEVGPLSAVAQAEEDHAPSVSGARRQASGPAGAVAVEVRAPDGAGGLGAVDTPEVGINARQARGDSLSLQLQTARFLKTQIGGLPAVSTTAVMATDAFSSRAARVRGDQPAGGRGATAPQTEEAIERGLAFLARYQQPDGSWSLQGFPEGATLHSDTAATALAVIAFHGAGYNHREFQHKDVVRAGIEHLLKSQKENGDLFVPLEDASNRSVWLYSHSLAAIAVCEAYGMTQDPALREPAQRAIDFVVASQHRERGGWRYSPGTSADTSVTGWMMMALKSGELAGLKVPQIAYTKIGRWLDDAQQSATEPHLYRYNPYAPNTSEQRHGRTASKTMTAVGLLMRLYTGWKRNNANMIQGADFLVGNLPAIGTTREPQRDTYYWYYATQVMAHMGGEHWQAWIARLHPLLVNSQLAQGPLAGSWEPTSPIADRWGPQAGRLYVTTMNLLSLEVQYRKLPLYDDAIR